MVLFLLFAALATAQDKIYFLDGSSKDCKITTISSEYLTVIDNGYESAISRSLVLLIEFKNGTVEVMNTPQDNRIYDPTISNPYSRNPAPVIYKAHFAGVNTLALFNSDVAAFYEYMPKSTPIGLEVMGAYNFNPRSSVQNIFISVLGKSKKNYDLGLGLKYYVSDEEDNLQISFGILMKYTNFTFDMPVMDSIPGQFGITSYRSTIGNQLATLLTFGGRTFLNDQVYASAMCGFGAFKLRGDYKELFNQEFSGSSSGSNYLPKMYLSFNLGFNF